MEITDITSVTGDVTVTQRKGKLRHNFDLNIKFSWSSSSGHEGLVEVRDFMSDTDLKGFEFYVKPVETAKESLPTDLKTIVASALRDAVWAKLQEFACDLIDEHGKHLLVDVSSPASPVDDSLTEEFKSAGISSGKSGESSSANLVTWKETVEFQAPASEIFKTLTESVRAMLWSRGSLEGSLAVKGSSFKMFSGAVSGTVLDIDPAKNSIILSWRLSAWPAGIVSEVNLTLEDIPSGCRLHLKQTGIPADQFEFTSTNWTNYYWNPIKATFGYGAFPKY